MKFLRFGSLGKEKPGFQDSNGRIRDLSDQMKDLDGANLDPDRLAALAKLNPDTVPVVEGSGQWFKGKSSNTFCPVGPWLVTTDEVNDPQNLNIWLEISRFGVGM